MINNNMHKNMLSTLINLYHEMAGELAAELATHKYPNDIDAATKFVTELNGIYLLMLDLSETIINGDSTQIMNKSIEVITKVAESRKIKSNNLSDPNNPPTPITPPAIDSISGGFN